MTEEVEFTQIVREGHEEHEESYTETVLRNKDVIASARDKFVAFFLAGVDRKRYKDAIDEMNNDFLRHGKEYPSDVPSMVTWLLKRRGGGSSNDKEDANTDGVLTSFAQMSFIQKGIRRE